jgi:hypothetical protein
MYTLSDAMTTCSHFAGSAMECRHTLHVQQRAGGWRLRRAGRSGMTPCLLLLVAAAGLARAASLPLAPPDPLWLRYPLVSDKNRLVEYRGAITTVRVAAAEPADNHTLLQLEAASSELRLGLSGLLGQPMHVACCHAVALGAGAATSEATTQLLVQVVPSRLAALGPEGFSIGRAASGVTVDAATPSGLLYGAFKLLSLMQQHKALPSDYYESAPAMERRVWNLWDNADGSIEQGFSGRSILWPYALLDDNRPPPRNKLFLRKCNASDDWQRWSVDASPTATAASGGNRSRIVNLANGECLSSEVPQNPMETTANHSACTSFSFNLNASISDSSLGRCMDVQFGEGPVVQLTSCKYPPTSDSLVEREYIRKQKFRFDPATRQIRTMPGARLHLS